MKGKKYTFIDVEVPIDEPKENIIYHCDNEKRIELLCPCGCKDLIVLNTIQSESPKWTIVNYNTIKPSIDRMVGCKSHFSIINGMVQ